MLKAFIELQQTYHIPSKQFYKYLQLRHALNAQARTSDLILTDHAIIEKVFMTTDKKGMISGAYFIILNAIQGDL